MRGNHDTGFIQEVNEVREFEHGFRGEYTTAKHGTQYTEYLPTRHQAVDALAGIVSNAVASEKLFSPAQSADFDAALRNIKPRVMEHIG